LASTRGGSSRTAVNVSTSRTGIDEATHSVASSGRRAPSSRATRGSLSSSPSAASMAAAAAASAARHSASQAASASAAVPSSSRPARTEPVLIGSGHAAGPGITTCSTSSWRSSHARRGADVGTSPTRRIAAGRCAATNRSLRSSAS
jgi:hypothetical protein